ncbi:MAG: 2,3-bisphosphoglycerate-independent phosphoglycerate mutase [Patescibacteria group bacterium]
MNGKVKPVVLVILDGWGIAPPSRGNAITLARTPVFKKLINTYPTYSLQAGGEAAGLPWGEMGNSEVGHLTLGAGKILYQDLPRINKAISDRSFFTNPALVKACENVKEKGSQLHLLGLVSPGGVHSYTEHLFALLELAKEQGVGKVFVHAILDGRDTPYNSGLGFIEDLQKTLSKLNLGKIASLSGRFYAMDRDNHWDRTEKFYNSMTLGKGETTTKASVAIKSYYEQKIYDEEIPPTVVTTTAGKPLTQVGPEDSVIFFNFRADRARQLTQSFVVSGFNKFKRQLINRLYFVSMTEYEKGLPATVAFAPEQVEKPLARLISEAGMRQLHIAETEKYAHVTYFFNGGREKAYDGEEHVLIPSPTVSSYDQKPAMSIRGILKTLIQEIRNNSYGFYVANFANADMVAHTGNLPATIKAVEFIDEALGEVVAAVLEVEGMLLITSDHGNAEGLVNLQTGVIDKEHSATPVPLIIISHDLEQKAASSSPITDDLSQLKPAGMLADIAPTILHLLDIPKPPTMTGLSLL